MRRLGTGILALGLAAAAGAADGPPPASPLALWLAMMEQWSTAFGDSRDQESRRRVFADLRRALPCARLPGKDGDAEEGEYCALDPNTGDRAR